MSQPKRYSVAVNDPWFGNGAYVAEEGKYVLHSDYAALAAEYVELKDLYLKCRIDIGNLHKKNERLRKAGDAMAERIDADGQPHLETDDWDAAKEGRDAK